MTPFVGTGKLLRLAWRRDRIMVIASLAVIWLMPYYSPFAMKALYPVERARTPPNTEANASTGVVAMYGHIVNTASVGGIAANKLAMINFFILAFLVIAIVRRHTRAEEESGRFELLGAAPVGRLAPLTAAVLLATVVSLASGLVSIPCAIAGGWPRTGSVALGLANAGVGLSFTAVAAVAMQPSANTRACSGWATGALGLAFVLRMMGDISYGRPAAFLSWLSPFGWGQQVRPYDGDRFWPLVVPLAFFVAMMGLAVVLQRSRDLGAGLLADRRGRATSRMGSPFALAWRLQRGSLLGWGIAYAVLGLMMGTIVSTIGGMLSGPAEEMLRKMGAVGKFTDLYLTMIGMVGALAAAAYGVSAALRLRSEESAGHLESLLGTPVRRLGFLASHVLIALVGTTLLQVVLGVSMAGAHAAAGESTGFWREFTPALIPLPAIWLMTGVAVAVIGWAPRLDWFGWAFLAGVIALTELGGFMGVPQRILDLTPFAALPHLPVDEMRWAPVLIETAIAVALLVLGAVGYRRRDIPVA